MRAARNALATIDGARDHLIPWLILASAGCYGAALFTPMVEVSTLLFDDPISIASLLLGLAADREYVLLAILTVFSVGFPLAKIFFLLLVYLFTAVDGAAFARRMWILERTGKWSMLDVMVVAVAIVALKSNIFVTMATNPGLYFFIAFVACSTLGFWRLSRAARRAGEFRGHNT